LKKLSQNPLTDREKYAILPLVGTRERKRVRHPNCSQGSTDVKIGQTAGRAEGSNEFAKLDDKPLDKSHALCDTTAVNGTEEKRLRYRKYLNRDTPGERCISPDDEKHLDN
jgi:hypothetical protein